MSNKQRAARIKMGMIYLKDFPTIGEGNRAGIYIDEIIVYYSLN